MAGRLEMVPTLRIVEPDMAGASSMPVILVPNDASDRHGDIALCQDVLAAMSCNLAWQAADLANLGPRGLKALSDRVFKAGKSQARLVFAGSSDVQADNSDPGQSVVHTLSRSAPGILLTYLHAAHPNLTARCKDLDVLLACPIKGEVFDEHHHFIGLHRNAMAWIDKTAEIHSRKKLCFLVDRKDKNPVILSYLRARSDPGAKVIDLDIIEIEQGVAELLNNPQRWDMVICLPQSRRLVQTIIAQVAGLSGPHAFSLQTEAETTFGADSVSFSEPLPAHPSLVANLQALIAMLSIIGLNRSAQDLYAALASVLGRGITVDGIRLHTPYSKSVSPTDFAALLIDAIKKRPRKTHFTSALGLPAAIDADAGRTAKLRVVC